MLKNDCRMRVLLYFCWLSVSCRVVRTRNVFFAVYETDWIHFTAYTHTAHSSDRFETSTAFRLGSQ
ncbi:hypothetical protein BDV98DRAFT_576678 [Pterulicium gracile]|uniref:Secreted protein n=1 Tax=Pterulicium gracile TaxID=1884261 RepID=A0A5C3Q7G6_9AGAR|nr:hypothetical protein BDV98DRAFT_576678 [Pterula gracilis]